MILLVARRLPTIRRHLNKSLGPAPKPRLRCSIKGMRKMFQLSFDFSREHWIQLWMLARRQTQTHLFYLTLLRLILLGSYSYLTLQCKWCLKPSSYKLKTDPTVERIRQTAFTPTNSWRWINIIPPNPDVCARVEGLISCKDLTGAQICLLGFCSPLRALQGGSAGRCHAFISRWFGCRVTFSRPCCAAERLSASSGVSNVIQAVANTFLLTTNSRQPDRPKNSDKQQWGGFYLRYVHILTITGRVHSRDFEYLADGVGELHGGLWLGFFPGTCRSRTCFLTCIKRAGAKTYGRSALPTLTCIIQSSLPFVIRLAVLHDVTKF